MKYADLSYHHVVITSLLLETTTTCKSLKACLLNIKLSRCIFSLETAKLLAIYDRTGFEEPVTSISFHPFDHSVAFSALGKYQPILVYTWNEESPPIEKGIAGTTSSDDQLGSPTPKSLKDLAVKLVNEAELSDRRRDSTKSSEKATLRSLGGETLEIEAKSVQG